jgi:hypothetical protein
MAPVDCALVIACASTAQNIGTRTPLVLETACRDSEGASTWGCRVQDTVVGYLSQDDLKRAHDAVGTTGHGVTASVRSVRRDPASKAVTSIQVCTVMLGQ